MNQSIIDKQQKETERLTLKYRPLSVEYVKNQAKLYLRMTKARGIDVQTLVDEEYS